jgi:hypothetical protein
MPHDIRLVTEADLRQSVTLDLEVIDCIVEAFRSLASGKVVMPPVLSMALPEVNAEVDVKTAYVPGLDGFALKVSPGFFDNPKLGLPSLNGLIVLLSARTGLVEAVFLDNGYLTDIRTAAAGAVAARCLAPEDCSTVGIIGTGVQARLQLLAASMVRNVKTALIWGRDDAKAEQLAAELAAELGIDVSATVGPGGPEPASRTPPCHARARQGQKSDHHCLKSSSARKGKTMLRNDRLGPRQFLSSVDPSGPARTRRQPEPHRDRRPRRLHRGP